MVSGVADRCRATALGLLIDRAVGEPPARVHPVAGFGALMSRVEEEMYAPSRTRGVVYAMAGVGVAALAGSIVPTAPAVACAAAGRELRAVASRVGVALDDDVERARTLLPALVGRDPSALDRSGIAAAVIESVAENTVDAVVAPAWWAAVAGARGALVHRAINTMDAMVGHRSTRYERFGSAAARLDDFAAWLPARITVGLVLVARPRARDAILRAVRDDAPAHPSPNAGAAEAAFAGALGVELGGPLHYGERAEDRPRLGCGPRPDAPHVAAAVRLGDDVERVLVLALAAVAAAGAVAGRSR
ncbi:MAG TPA: adenosylcobinamide-phosphate synthase CbiB [Acidimicrobiia bacterium]|nr:adenosylcobinamide-phosphate synthase CbiB [Acidimicrobiia bacterium]